MKKSLAQMCRQYVAAQERKARAYRCAEIAKTSEAKSAIAEELFYAICEAHSIELALAKRFCGLGLMIRSGDENKDEDRAGKIAIAIAEVNREI